jgi:hypothetical protein
VPAGDSCTAHIFLWMVVCTVGKQAHRHPGPCHHLAWPVAACSAAASKICSVDFEWETTSSGKDWHVVGNYVTSAPTAGPLPGGVGPYSACTYVAGVTGRKCKATWTNLRDGLVDRIAVGVSAFTEVGIQLLPAASQCPMHC